MEFRWLVRTAIAPRPLLSASSLRLRPFSHSSRFAADPPLPTTAAETETKPAAAPTASPSPTMAEIFGFAVSNVPPTRREFESPSASSARFSAVIPADFRTTLAPPPLGARAAPRTGPSAGRSVPVITDLPQALTRLRGILTANNVRADQLRQRFHERPGMKKKRLKSLRHRRRFKAGFKKLVTIAMEMKRKGL